MNYEDDVTCVAICEKELMIVSRSDDGNVCRWNIETSAMDGEAMCGHERSVRCISADEDG